MIFFRLEKMFLIAIFLFIDRFKKTLNQNLWFDQLSYWISEKFTFSKKKCLFIPDFCKCPINLILLYPLISYFLPENFIFQLQVLEHTKTNILSYYTQKSVCKQKSYSFQKFSGNLTLKNHCQLFFTNIIFFSFSKVSILYGKYDIKIEIQYHRRKIFFFKILEERHLKKNCYHGRSPLKIS